MSCSGGRAPPCVFLSPGAVAGPPRNPCDSKPKRAHHNGTCRDVLCCGAPVRVPSCANPLPDRRFIDRSLGSNAWCPRGAPSGSPWFGSVGDWLRRSVRHLSARLGVRVFLLQRSHPQSVTLPNPFPAQAPQVSAYAVPDQVIAASIPNTTLAAQSAVVYSSLQAANVLAANVASGAMLPASGPFALSPTVLTTSESLQRPQTYSAVAVTQRTVTMYQAAVAWQAQTLDPIFVAAVDNLPGLYDPVAYSLFTQNYGTHVLVSGTFGGQAVEIASVNSPQGRPESSSAIAQQALVNFQYVTSGNTGPQPAGWFIGDSSGPSSFKVRKCTTAFLHATHRGSCDLYSPSPPPPHTHMHPTTPNPPTYTPTHKLHFSCRTRSWGVTRQPRW